MISWSQKDENKKTKIIFTRVFSLESRSNIVKNIAGNIGCCLIMFIYEFKLWYSSPTETTICCGFECFFVTLK